MAPFSTKTSFWAQPRPATAPGWRIPVHRSQPPGILPCRLPATARQAPCRTILTASSNCSLVLQDAGEVRLWDVKSGAQLGALAGHTGCVLNVAWSPDDNRVASCGEDDSVRLWDTRHCRLIFLLGDHEGSVVCIAFSPNGAMLASGSGERLRGLGMWGLGLGFGLWFRPGFSREGSGV